MARKQSIRLPRFEMEMMEKGVKELEDLLADREGRPKSGRENRGDRGARPSRKA